MNNTIHITGSTIGAMAVGPGAQASNTTATDRVGGKFSLDIKARFASRAQIWSWLRTATDRVDKGTGLEDHFAETVGPSSFSMSLDSETPGAVAHVDNDVLLAEIKRLAGVIAENDPAKHRPGKRLLSVVRDVLAEMAKEPK